MTMKKTIMLACAAGMSTSLLVQRMLQAAQEQITEGKAVDFTIFAVPASEAAGYIAEKSVDVVLLGPQVRFMEEEFKQQAAPQHIPIGVIPMMDYGMMNGKNVLTFAINLMIQGDKNE